MPTTGGERRLISPTYFVTMQTNFFQSRFPDFYLTEITIGGSLLDVLVIENAPHKPYYLIKRFEKICAHHIYTRVCDTNTPARDAAQPDEIERMWRERFGLDIPPLERFKLYLNDFDAWASPNSEGNLHAHYKTFPEFTLKVVDAEDYMACNEEWTRGEIRTDNNHAAYYELYYHQTCLTRVRYVSFDDHKKSMVAPSWQARGAGRFYYYEADSIGYAVQKYHSAVGEDDSAKISIRSNSEIATQARSRWGHQMTIPVLCSGELDGFLGHSDRQYVEPSRNETEQYEIFLRNQLEFEDWRKQQGKI